MTENLQKILNDIKFDKRLVDWYMRRGQLTKEDLKKHLETLPDLSSEVSRFELDEDSNGSAESTLN